MSPSLQSVDRVGYGCWPAHARAHGTGECAAARVVEAPLRQEGPRIAQSGFKLWVSCLHCPRAAFQACVATAALRLLSCLVPDLLTTGCPGCGVFPEELFNEVKEAGQEEDRGRPFSSPRKSGPQKYAWKPGSRLTHGFSGTAHGLPGT